MRIISKSSIETSLYKKYPDSIKIEMQKTICEKLIKYNNFITPLIYEHNDYTLAETQLFVLTNNDIDNLKKLCDKYPELFSIIKNIIVDE